MSPAGPDPDSRAALLAPSTRRFAVDFLPGVTDREIDDEALSTPERIAAIELGSIARRLLEAVVSSQASPSELAAVVEGIRGIAEQMEAGAEEFSVHAIDDLAAGVRMFNPAVGQANPVAPPIRLYMTPIGSELGWLEFGRIHEGVPGYAHGGFTALVLDQVMTRANGLAGTAGVTLNMQIEYHRVVPVGERLVVSAEVVQQEGRKVRTRSWIAAASDPETPLASATGLFLQLPPGRLMELLAERARPGD